MPDPAPSSAPPAQQLLLNLCDEPIPSLDSFVAGANARVLHTLRARPAGRALYLWGEAGSGRTHLLRAAANAPGGHYVHASAAASALHRIMHAMHEADDSESPVVCVAVDDAHLLDAHAQAALFTLYNRWRALAASPRAFCLMTAADRAPQALSLREDLRTRLGWDLVLRLQPLSDDDRTQVLLSRAAQRGVALAPDILQWLLTHYSRDLRRLCPLVDALDRYSLQTLKPVTLPLLKTVLTHAHDARATGAV